jgi:hypothetical protein
VGQVRRVERFGTHAPGWFHTLNPLIAQHGIPHAFDELCVCVCSKSNTCQWYSLEHWRGIVCHHNFFEQLDVFGAHGYGLFFLGCRLVVLLVQGSRNLRHGALLRMRHRCAGGARSRDGTDAKHDAIYGADSHNTNATAWPLGVLNYWLIVVVVACTRYSCMCCLGLVDWWMVE